MPFRVHAVPTMTSGSTLTSEVDLGDHYSQAYLEVPTMTSATDIYIQASRTTGGTFRRVIPGAGIRTFTVATAQAFIIGSAVSQHFVEIPAGFRFVKVEHSTACTATAHNYNIVVCYT